jgi:cobalamin biosynthesis protein CobT
MPGQQPQQIAVCQRLQHLRAVAEIIETRGREDLSAVLLPQTVQRRQGRSVSVVQAFKRFEQLGFSLMVGDLWVLGFG